MKNQSNLLSALFELQQEHEPLRIAAIESVSSSEPSENLAHLKATDINAFNSEAERRFVAITCELIADLGEQSPAAVVREAAYELNISTETAKRYLFKHTARRAHFGINDRNLVFCRHALNK